MDTLAGTKQQNRKIYLDLLRIFACFSVVMLHGASQYWYYLPVTGMEWGVCNLYDALFRFGVPIFVMISGMLFLANQGTGGIKSLLTRNVLRLFLVWLIWSSVYGLWGIRLDIGQGTATWKTCLEAIMRGRYHLWFLPMMLGIYFLIPLLRRLVAAVSKRQLEYFLLLFLVFQVGSKSLQALPIPYFLTLALGQFDIPAVCSYVGYFLLGYYLWKFPPTGGLKKAIYLAGIISAPAVVLLSARISAYYGTPRGDIFDSFSLFTFFISTALFVFFQDKVATWQLGARTEKWIENISKDTLGIYLVHIGVLELLQQAGIDTMIVGPILGIPLVVLLCFCSSMVVAAVLRRIPYIGRYLC